MGPFGAPFPFKEGILRKLLLLVLGLVLLLPLPALAAGDGEGPPLDRGKVVEAELEFWSGSDMGEVKSAHGQATAEAARKRFEFQSADYDELDFWFDLLGGPKKVGMVTLEDDGSVTIEYVGKEPDVSVLPEGFEYQLVKTNRSHAQRAANLVPIDQNTLVTDPDEPHTTLRAGQMAAISCGNVVNSPVGFPKHQGGSHLPDVDIGAAVITADVRFTQTGVSGEQYGVVTVGHAFIDNGVDLKNESCGPSNGKDFNTHIWTGSIQFPTEFYGTTFNDSIAWWNAEGNENSGGREDGGRVAWWRHTSYIDLSLVKKASSTRGLVHLDPVHPFTNEGDLPSGWTPHGTRFSRVVSWSVDNATYCTIRTKIPYKGIDCGTIEHDDGNTYRLYLDSGWDMQPGESGSPVFSIHPNPKLYGIVTNTAVGPSYEALFQRLYYQIRNLDNAIADIGSLEVCGVDGNNSSLSDRTHTCD